MVFSGTAGHNYYIWGISNSEWSPNGPSGNCILQRHFQIAMGSCRFIGNSSLQFGLWRNREQIFVIQFLDSIRPDQLHNLYLAHLLVRCSKHGSRKVLSVFHNSVCSGSFRMFGSHLLFFGSHCGYSRNAIHQLTKTASSSKLKLTLELNAVNISVMHPLKLQNVTSGSLQTILIRHIVQK